MYARIVKINARRMIANAIGARKVIRVLTVLASCDILCDPKTTICSHHAVVAPHSEGVRSSTAFATASFT